MAEVEEDFNEFVCERIDSKFETLNSNIEYQDKRKKLSNLHKEIFKHLPTTQQHLIEEYELVSSSVQSLSEKHSYTIGFKDGIRIIHS